MNSASSTQHLLEGLEYIWIPPGQFKMGAVPEDKAAQDEEYPRHEVRITQGFWMTQSPVTVAAYRTFCKAKHKEPPPYGGFQQDDDHPVVKVNYTDAVAYCEWAGCRLPSEAEWEYAARGGREGLSYPWGNAIDHGKANYYGDGQRWKGTSPVKTFAPNGFDLYDMAGNVWEWCSDWFDPDYYTSSPHSDPRGPAGRGNARVIRGGSWGSNACSLRVSGRGKSGIQVRGSLQGFRCVFEEGS